MHQEKLKEQSITTRVIALAAGAVMWGTVLFAQIYGEDITFLGFSEINLIFNLFFGTMITIMLYLLLKEIRMALKNKRPALD